MAFLVDNNLSPKVAEVLCEHFSNSCHVTFLNMDSASDELIWLHAKETGLAILSKDNDFEAKSRLYGCPPKVVQMKCENLKTRQIPNIFRAHVSELSEFLTDTEDCLLLIN